MKQRVIRNKEKLMKLFEKNPPDFSEGKFRGVRLAGAVFRNLNFEKADFRDADLREVNFTKSNLASVNFESADLFKSCLRNSNLTKAWLAHSNLSRSQLKNANLTHAIINGANFGEVHDLTQDQLDSCVLITGKHAVMDVNLNHKDLPKLPEGLKPSFKKMTYKEWLALEEDSEFLGV